MIVSKFDRRAWLLTGTGITALHLFLFRLFFWLIGPAPTRYPMFETFAIFLEDLISPILFYFSTFLVTVVAFGTTVFSLKELVTLVRTRSLDDPIWCLVITLLVPFTMFATAHYSAYLILAVMETFAGWG